MLKIIFYMESLNTQSQVHGDNDLERKEIFLDKVAV